MMHQFPTRGVIYQSKGKNMLYLAGLIYYRTNNSTTILHILFIIVILLFFLSCDKILLKLVIPYRSFGDTKQYQFLQWLGFILDLKTLVYNTTSFGCHAFLLDKFWYLHTTSFGGNYRPHPKVRLLTSSVMRG